MDPLLFRVSQAEDGLRALLLSEPPGTLNKSIRVVLVGGGWPCAWLKSLALASTMGELIWAHISVVVVLRIT